MSEKSRKKFPDPWKILQNLDYYIAVACLLFVTVYCFLNVVCRFIIGKTSASLDELNMMVFVWFLYAAITYCVRIGRHIRIEFLTLYLSKKGQILIRLIGDFIWMLFSGYIAYAGLRLIMFNTKFLARSSMLKIPNYIVYSVIFLSFAAMTIFLMRHLWEIWGDLRTQMRGGK